MVQVDVFWSYGIGASFGVAAARHLEKSDRSWLDSPYFTRTLLVLSLLFVPSGAWLLWAFPSWETMHVGDRDLPVWLTTAFTITNVTQGILGFWATVALARRGRAYLAFLQWPAAYFGMFFILVHGWDGSGYQRFFSSTREAFEAWGPGNVGAWFKSNVALSLYGMGVFIVPALLYFPSRWIREGYATDPRVNASRAAARSTGTLAWLSLLTIFGGGLGTAILASLAVRYLGWGLGLGAFAIAAYAILLRAGGLMHKLYLGMFCVDEGSSAAAPRAELARA